MNGKEGGRHAPPPDDWLALAGGDSEAARFKCYGLKPSTHQTYEVLIRGYRGYCETT